MNSVGNLIAMHDPDFVLLSKPQRLVCVTTVLLYICRGCKAAELNDLLKESLDWSGKSCIDFRAKLANGYLLKNFKLYFYARVIGEKVRAEDFGITPADVALVNALLRSQTELSQRLLNVCRVDYADGYPARSLEVFDRAIHKAVVKLRESKWSEKFVKKKFKFLTRSGQLTEDIIISSMTDYGLRAVYRAYPRIKNVLHLMNIMKAGMRNRGQNIIKEETTLKRKRLVCNDDGTFSGVVLSLNFADYEQTFSQERIGSGSMSVCNSLMCGLDGTSCEYERPTDVDRIRDLRQVVDTILVKTRGEDPKRFISLLMGLYDEEFSTWLGQDNDAAVSKMDRHAYCEKVRKFMRLPRSKARDFMQFLRTELADFHA